MRFSKQQQQFEHFLADKLKGHVQLYATVHRRAHDQPAKVWLVYKGEEILHTDDLAFQVRVNQQYAKQAMELPRISYNANWEMMMQSAERQALVNLSNQIEQRVMEDGFYPAWLFYQALNVFYKLPIEEALHHENELVQVLAMLDRRLGKRRLAAMKPQQPLVQKFHALRCEVEDITNNRKEGMNVSHLANTYELPYYAVIFASERTEGDHGYNAMAAKMAELASKQKGYLGVESARDADLGITVSYWQTLEDIATWKANAAHQVAQQRGRQEWYSRFALRICKVERDYLFEM